MRRALEGDAVGLCGGLVRMGFYAADDEEVTPERVMGHFRAVTDWYREDRAVALEPDYVRRILVDIGDPRSEHWPLMRRATIPPDRLLASRMEALTLGVLGQLRATANWHRVAREWLFDDPPATPLGEAEAAFWERAARGRRRATAGRTA